MAVERQVVLAVVRRHIVDNVLEGQDIGLEDTTPLIEWGIINSIEVMRLTRLVEERFGISVPLDTLPQEHFATLSSIADFVVGQGK
jgi:acyl carrier protein